MTKWARENDVNSMGHANPNPILDSRQCVVDFEDSTQAELTANNIAHSMYNQCDPDGNQYLMLDSIVYFRYNTTALCYDDQNFVNNGRTYRRRSTAGWKMCFQWKGGSKYLQNLSYLKQSHLIDTTEYVISQNLQGEPEFNWWVPHVIKKRERVTLLVKKWIAWYLKKAHKFVVRLPKIVEEAYNIDADNGNVLCTNSIPKEMTNVKINFKALEDSEYVPIGYAYVCCHMIFAVKMEGF